jgi:hypothetical protein
MLKDLLGFLNGTIIKEDHTASKVILSNGHSYNAKLFHQSLGIVRLLLNKEVNSEEQQEFLALVKAQQIKALEFQTERLIDLERHCSLSDLELLQSKPLKISFGRYKGEYSNTIKNPKYLIWALSVRTLENIVETTL